MDAHLRHILDRLASVMSRSNAGLQKAYVSGASKPLIDRIRSSEPLYDSEREFIALLLEGSLGRERHKRRATISLGMKRSIFAKVRQMKAALATKNNPSTLGEIFDTVAQNWNANPSNGPKITAAQVEQIYCKAGSEIRNAVSPKR